MMKSISLKSSAPTLQAITKGWRKNLIRAAALAMAFLAPTGAAIAQDLIAEYFTSIRAHDRVNSSGMPLNNFCATVQQDRANYHRFGIRDDGDQGDPIFSNKEARARILDTCVAMPGSEYVPQFILDGIDRYIWVKVYGRNGVPIRVEIREGAG